MLEVDTEEMELQWMAALLSGDFKQTKGYLKMSPEEALYRNEKPGHCCLGVACEIYKTVTGKGEWKDDQYFRLSQNGDWNDGYPPPSVEKAFGITHEQAMELAKLNDSDASFEDIARVIGDRDYKDVSWMNV